MSLRPEFTGETQRPSCMRCQGLGHVARKACTLCEGTGQQPPAVPLVVACRCGHGSLTVMAIKTDTRMRTAMAICDVCRQPFYLTFKAGIVTHVERGVA